MKTLLLSLTRLLKRVLRNRCKEFPLGEGIVRRYTIIEIRWLFSVYIHEISTLCQDRFHTHAFNAVGITYLGGYTEEQLPCVNHPGPGAVRRISGVRFIPRMMNHRLMRAEPHTHTLLITGPYSGLWTEEDSDWVRVLTTHQVELGRFPRRKA